MHVMGCDIEDLTYLSFRSLSYQLMGHYILTVLRLIAHHCHRSDDTERKKLYLNISRRQRVKIVFHFNLQ